jgi:hypothetical protein
MMKLIAITPNFSNAPKNDRDANIEGSSMHIEGSSMHIECRPNCIWQFLTNSIHYDFDRHGPYLAAL